MLCFFILRKKIRKFNLIIHALTGNVVVSRQEVRRYLLLHRYFPLPMA